MTLPTIKVEIDFSTGASFGYPFVLDSPLFGVLDINILADGPLDLVDITPQVRRVSTRRGRNRLLSQFEAGTATVRIIVVGRFNLNTRCDICNCTRSRRTN
jgi:hypothetical protein